MAMLSHRNNCKSLSNTSVISQRSFFSHQKQNHITLIYYLFLFFQIVELLISHGANVNIQKECGWTPLHKACELGRSDVVRALIAAGANVNAAQEDAITCLYSAAHFGHSEV